MFYLLNKHKIFQIVLIAGLLLLSVFRIFTEMLLLPPDGQMILYQVLFPIWNNHPLQYKFLAVTLLIIEILLIQWYYNAHNFADGKTFMPALFFLILLNTGKVLTTFSPLFFTVVFFTVILAMNMNVDKEQPIKNTVFFSGLLVGIAVLFDPVAVWIAVFVMLALIANQYSKAKEIAILFSGLLTTFLYVFAFYFITDNLPQLGTLIRQYPYFGIVHSFQVWNVMDSIVAVCTFIFVLYMMVTLKMYFDNKLIVLRKRLVTIHLLFIVSAIMLFFSMYDFMMGVCYLFIPITLYFSMMCLFKSRRFLNDMMIVTFVVLLCL